MGWLAWGHAKKANKSGDDAVDVLVTTYREGPGKTCWLAGCRTMLHAQWCHLAAAAGRVRVRPSQRSIPPLDHHTP